MKEIVDPIYDKTTQCLFCSYSFKTKKVRSRFTRPVHTETDFCTTYKQEEYSPLLYVVTVCKKCGFSFSDQFNPHFKPDVRKLIQKELVDRWTPQDYTKKRTLKEAINAYKLCIYSATLKQERPVVLAGLYLRLVWLYRKEGNKEQEQRFMRLCESMYKKAYRDDDLANSDMSTLKVLYLIGEINRRLDNYPEAIRYFSRVVERQGTDFDPKMVEMAREQWYEVREAQQALRSS